MVCRVIHVYSISRRKPLIVLKDPDEMAFIFVFNF